VKQGTTHRPTSHPEHLYTVAFLGRKKNTDSNTVGSKLWKKRITLNLEIDFAGQCLLW